MDLGDLGTHVVLVGGQVLALEDLAEGGSGIIQVETATGIVVERGFSMEPDLLFDTDSDAAQVFGERLPQVLRERGFVPTRGFRWSKDVAGEPMHLDLFCAPGTEGDAPTSMLFADESAPGVRDLLGYAPTLGEMDRQLLIREAIDLFAELEREVTRIRAAGGESGA